MTKEDHLSKIEPVKLLRGEKILNIQRQHWFVLVPQLASHIVIIAIAFGLLFVFLYQTILPFAEIRIVLVDITLLILTVLAVVGTYMYMDWYYHFYVITNKRLISTRVFRLGGKHLDEVFLETTPEHHVEEVASNILFDFLDIEDVYVYFHVAEKPEPFIFKTPTHTGVIVDILNKLSGRA